MESLVTAEMIANAKRRGRYTEVLNSEVTVKCGESVTRAQFDLLSTIHDTGAIPCPRPFEFHVITPKCNAIFMSTMPGRTWNDAAEHLTLVQIAEIAKSIVESLAALNIALCADGHQRGAFESPAESGSIIFPFRATGFTPSPVSPADFVDTMMKHNPQGEGLQDEQRRLLRSLITPEADDGLADISFFHMDLQPNNVMIKDGKFAGLVDWDWAGWYTFNMAKYVMCYSCEWSRRFRDSLLEAWGCKNDPMIELASGRIHHLLVEGHQREVKRLKLRKIKRQREEKLAKSMAMG